MPTSSPISSPPAKKYGIRPGLYYSTGCNGYCGIVDSDKQDYRSPKYRDYVAMVERQLVELWGNYGELFELWFDGGVIPRELGGPDIPRLIKTYQPNAICFQGPCEHTQNLRWVGNERGLAPIDCWSTSKRNTCGFGGDEEDDVVGIGNPDGAYWIPAETDVGNRRPNAFGGGWEWAAGQESLVYPPEELLARYIASVGRNSNLLVGMCISQRGHFEDAWQFERFGELVADLYKRPAATMRGIGNEHTLRLEAPELIRHIVIKEDIHYGERVREFTVETDEGNSFKPCFSAHCIGHKRIIELGRNVTAARLKITRAVDEPIIKEFTCYK